MWTAAMVFLIGGLLYLHTSLRGKQLIRAARLLDRLDLRGDEHAGHRL